MIISQQYNSSINVFSNVYIIQNIRCCGMVSVYIIVLYWIHGCSLIRRLVGFLALLHAEHFVLLKSPKLIKSCEVPVRPSWVLLCRPFRIQVHVRITQVEWVGPLWTHYEVSHGIVSVDRRFACVSHWSSWSQRIRVVRRIYKVQTANEQQS